METKQKQITEIGRVLIVEDQGDPLRLLESVVKEIVPKYFPNFQAEETPILFGNYGCRQAQIQCFTTKDYDVARSVASARDMFSENKYGLILLDHRMPLEDIAEPEAPTGVNVDYTEYFKQERVYSDCLRNIGYSLIPEIRSVNPNAVIVGTSSMKRELGDFPSPDFSLSKLNAKVDLERILQEISDGGDKKWVKK